MLTLERKVGGNTMCTRTIHRTPPTLPSLVYKRTSFDKDQVCIYFYRLSQVNNIYGDDDINGNCMACSVHIYIYIVYTSYELSVCFSRRNIFHFTWESVWSCFQRIRVKGRIFYYLIFLEICNTRFARISYWSRYILGNRYISII